MIGSDTIGLLFRMSAQNDASPEVKKFRDDVDKATKDIKSAGDNALTDFAKKLGFTADQTAVLSKTIPIAGAAIAGMAAIAVGAGVALFALAKSASDSGSEIFDASKKTGLGAETLSSLKFAADQSGSSLEELTGSVVKFSRLIGEAAEGSEKAKDKLVRLGLDPLTAINDLDGSLATIFKRIQEAENPIVKVKLATEAFGKSGANIIPVIDSFDGNLQKLIEDCKKLGVTITDEAAAKADEFGDSLDRNSAQIKGVSNQIGFALIPQINELASTFSDFLTANKSEIIGWAQTAIEWTSRAINNIRLWKAILQDAQTGFTGGNFGIVSTQIEQEKRDRENEKNTADVERMMAAKRPKKLGGGGLEDFDSQRKEAEEAGKKREEALKKQIADLEKYNKLKLDAEKQLFDDVQNSWETALENRTKTFDEYKTATLNNLDAFSTNVRKILGESFALTSKGKTGQEFTNEKFAYENAVRAFNATITEQKNELTKKQAETEKQAADESIKLAEATEKQKYEIAEAVRETGLAKLEESRRKNLISETTYAKSVAALKILALQSERAELQKNINGLEIYSEKWNELQTEILVLDEKIKQQRIENTENITEAQRVQNAELHETQTLLEGIGHAEEKRRGVHGGENEDESAGGAGGTPGGGIFDIFTKGIGGIFGQDSLDNISNGADFIKGLYGDLKGFASDAIGSMVSGLADLVAQWAVTGDFSLTAALKMAAGVAAGIAVQAGIKAIFELAEGFAALGNPFLAWTAPFHFKAAALYGTVAGVSLAASFGLGALSRATAGNQAASGATGGAFGSSTRTGEGGQVYSSNRDKQVLDMARNMSAAVPEQKIIIESKGGLAFEELFIIRYDNGGRMRDRIRKSSE